MIIKRNRKNKHTRWKQGDIIEAPDQGMYLVVRIEGGYVLVNLMSSQAITPPQLTVKELQDTHKDEGDIIHRNPTLVLEEG
jgi:hypothetical protein